MSPARSVSSSTVGPGEPSDETSAAPSAAARVGVRRRASASRRRPEGRRRRVCRGGRRSPASGAACSTSSPGCRLPSSASSAPAGVRAGTTYLCSAWSTIVEPSAKASATRSGSTHAGGQLRPPEISLAFLSLRDRPALLDHPEAGRPQPAGGRPAARRPRPTGGRRSDPPRRAARRAAAVPQ